MLLLQRSIPTDKQIANDLIVELQICDAAIIASPVGADDSMRKKINAKAS